jgi:hypothetical protein
MRPVAELIRPQSFACRRRAGAYGKPTFDAESILVAIDRLREIDAAMPPEMRVRYVGLLDPEEDIPF